MKNCPADKIRNVTLMGHGGVGKTSLAEAILFNAKVTDRLGKVTDGNTVMDFDAEENRRGISINTAVATLDWFGGQLNLIDTPGDFDFLGEQMQGMRAGDTVLVVLSAKDGLSVGAEKAVRISEKRQQPLGFFVNRMDEPNANFANTITTLQDRYGARVVPLAMPIMQGDAMVGVVDVVDLKAYSFATKGARTTIDIPTDLKEIVDLYRNNLMEQVAESDEALMDKFFAGESFSDDELQRGLQNAIATRSLYPVFVGASTANIGIVYLMDTMMRFFPSPVTAPAVGATLPNGEKTEVAFDADGPLVAFVFKTIVDPFVGRISMFRVLRGTFKGNQSVYNPRTEKEERVAGVFQLRGKKQIPCDEIGAGGIGAVAKLIETSTNDTLCDRDNRIIVDPIKFPTPCLTLTISPKTKGDEDKIMQGLHKLRDEDQVFRIRNDKETHQLLLSGLGETQLDVLCSKLKTKFAVEALLSEPRVAYRETIKKKVKVQGKHKKQSGGHGQYGDVWVEFEPGDKEELEFCEKIFGGSVPKNFHPAVEKGLQDAIEHGPLAGYPVVNLKATLVDGSYHDVDSSEMSFKLAARLAYKTGLPQAGPILLEPISTLAIHIPKDYLGDIMGDITKHRGRIMGIDADSDDGFQVIEAEAPTSELAKYATNLKSMTQGRGWYTIDFARYEQAPTIVADKVIAEAKRIEEEE